MAKMRMAKSSPEEMEKMLAFFNGLEAIFEGEFEQSDFGDYDMEQREAISDYVVDQWGTFLSFAWARFYWGFDTLLRNAVEPNSPYLEWKSEIKKALELHDVETAVSEEKS